MRAFPKTSTSDSTTVTAASAQFSQTLAADQYYVFVSSTNCWVTQGANPQTAVAADGNMFVPAGVMVYIDGALGAKVAVIRDTADGMASLTRVKTQL